MGNDFVLRGNICHTPTRDRLPHPQQLNLAERVERAVYLGLDEKGIVAKFAAGRKIG